MEPTNDLDLRTQNLADAAKLLGVLRDGLNTGIHRHLPELWVDLTEAQIADEVDRLGHIVEWLNLS